MATGIVLLSASLSSTGRASAQDGEGSMILDVRSGGECSGATCTVPLAGEFALAVEIEDAPSEGYILAQTFIDFGARLTYNPTEEQIDEILWPDCNDTVAVRAQTIPQAVNHGCLTGLIPPLPLSTYVGGFLELSFTCSREASTTVIRLLPYDDSIARTSGAAFVLEDGVTHVTVPLTSLTVNCGSGGSPEPTYTPGPTADIPPAATSGTAATPAPGETSVSDPQATEDGDTLLAGGSGDAEDNDGNNTVLIIVIVVVVLALAGAGGFYFWRQRIGPGSPPAGGQE